MSPEQCEKEGCTEMTPRYGQFLCPDHQVESMREAYILYAKKSNDFNSYLYRGDSLKKKKP